MRHTVTFILSLFVLGLVAVLPACGDKGGSSDGFQIVATTGHINDALQAITAGTEVDIKLLCGPGVDPHSYSASTGDVKAMDAADLIVWNGFHLEAQLEDLMKDNFKAKAWAMASAFPTEHRLDWVEDGEVDPKAPFDPHIWNHLEGWATCVEALAARLGEVDAANAETFKTNGKAYADKVREAHAWAKTLLAEIQRSRGASARLPSMMQCA